MPSRCLRFIPIICWATIGCIGNIERRKKKFKKAGCTRWLGRRPTVRGSAINPVDHPHGGGEGRCSIGHKRPLTLWGKLRRGIKTRSKIQN